MARLCAFCTFTILPKYRCFKDKTFLYPCTILADKLTDKVAANERKLVDNRSLSCFLCPKAKVSALNCKTKLQVLNFISFDAKTKSNYCYVWKEV